MDDGAVDVNKLCGAQLLVRLTGRASTSSSQRHGGEAGNGESKRGSGIESRRSEEVRKCRDREIEI
jgi:hypothetical protein